MTPVIFLLALGLAVRLTLLVVDDEIARPFRDRLTLLAHTEGNKSHKLWEWLRYLVHCPWCTSVWASAASFAYASTGSPSFVWVAGAAGASWLVGLAAMLTYWAQGE